ncbi:deoxynucleoside kinase [Accumulibacter sp.]|uniref:Deoxynucleoside kinase n=1 Tax=Candidatus Accumulibacter proximus TaxID=2954385 RepID=A0A935UJ27_9PROT|nr:deoxynucleoside kinase [Accumulibacter sp.]MBK7677255.1 deoxynucleoside kinase [Candidatus Accumulibacter proximus]MBL8374979.1 deoxynucleoside kinase [Accumulibacter sp.]
MSTRNTLTAARHIVIEGPIGVGKTSLAHRLGAHLDAELHLEQPELNPFLSRFYQDQQRYALQTQLFFLCQRIDKLRDLSQPDLVTRPVIADFLLEKDSLFALLTLSEDEYGLYRQICEHLSPQTAPPDLVIYLQAKPETLIARVRRRGIDMERSIGDAYLTRLAESYMHFFHNYNAAPVMVVNSENINFVDSDDDFQLLVKRIEAMRGHREYFNRGE